MTLALGVDTGGTFTDAVLIRDETDVIASAKALTSKQDLAIGIGAAVESVLRAAAVAPGEIALASLSTTLATNALVEGQGGRVALIFIGFREQDVEKHGLREALRGDPVLVLAGGHNHAGGEAAPLDEAGLRHWLATQAQAVSGFAVAAQFATRNPAHELRAQALIREITGRPVSCSHHLSAKLNGPKRAMTAVLNARLIGLIDRLIDRAEDKLQSLGITAPLMVVRGDGALISAALARERPIETILSGPAASIVGARWLTGAKNALVSDIGGTTTDVAMLRNGRPAIDPDGARVGPFRTMVEAVAMRTFGLGGDSEVQVNNHGLSGGVTLGPRRLLPISLLAIEAPELVHKALDRQLRSSVPNEHDAKFIRAIEGVDTAGLVARDIELLSRIRFGLRPLSEVLLSRLDHTALRRLLDRGLVQLAGVTPTDAAHRLGMTKAWDQDAAQKALELVSRKRVGSGNRLATGSAELARLIVDQLTEQSVLALLETAFGEEDTDFHLPSAELARHILLHRGLAKHRGVLALDAALNLPVIGLGASAPSYYPAVGEALNAKMILPKHSDVANAIGAVTGRVTMRKTGMVTSPSEGQFRVHLAEGPKDFAESAAAMSFLEQRLRQLAQAEAERAGAEGIHLLVSRNVTTAQAESREVFIEAEIKVEATGRPRITGR